MSYGKTKPTIHRIMRRALVEILDGFDGFSVKPKRFLGDTWSEVNEVMRSLGGKWQKGLKSTDGAWRIPK